MFIFPLALFAATECKDKWRNLRDTYVKYVKKVGREGQEGKTTFKRWKFICHLDFLRSTLPTDVVKRYEDTFTKNGLPVPSEMDVYTEGEGGIEGGDGDIASSAEDDGEPRAKIERMDVTSSAKPPPQSLLKAFSMISVPAANGDEGRGQPASDKPKVMLLEWQRDKSGAATLAPVPAPVGATGSAADSRPSPTPTTLNKRLVHKPALAPALTWSHPPAVVTPAVVTPARIPVTYTTPIVSATPVMSTTPIAYSMASDPDGIEHFVLSLVPILRRLPPKAQVATRLQVLEIVSKAELEALGSCPLPHFHWQSNQASSPSNWPPHPSATLDPHVPAQTAPSTVAATAAAVTTTAMVPKPVTEGELTVSMAPAGSIVKPITVKPAASTTIKPAASTTIKPVASNVKPAGSIVKRAGSTIKRAGSTIKRAGSTIMPAASTVEPVNIEPVPIKRIPVTIKAAASSITPSGLPAHGKVAHLLHHGTPAERQVLSSSSSLRRISAGKAPTSTSGGSSVVFNIPTSAGKTVTSASASTPASKKTVHMLSPTMSGKGVGGAGINLNQVLPSGVRLVLQPTTNDEGGQTLVLTAESVQTILQLSKIAPSSGSDTKSGAGVDEKRAAKLDGESGEGDAEDAGKDAKNTGKDGKNTEEVGKNMGKDAGNDGKDEESDRKDEESDKKDAGSARKDGDGEGKGRGGDGKGGDCESFHTDSEDEGDSAESFVVELSE